MKKIVMLMFLLGFLFVLGACDGMVTPGVSYEVLFESNGGTDVEAQSVKSGKLAVEPEDPILEGFVLDGWYTDELFVEGTLYDFETAVRSDLTLYAKWREPVLVQVVFTANGGSLVAEQSVLEGESVLEPEDPVRQGFVFDGWFTDSAFDDESLYDFSKPLKGSLTLYAKWSEIVTYDVVFASNGGSLVTTQTILEGEKATEPADPIRAGFIFDGWFTDATFASGSLYDFNALVTEDLTLYAQWTEDQQGLSDQEELELDFAAFSDYADLILTELILTMPTRGENGTVLTWTVTDFTAMTNKGVAIPDPIGGEDKIVTVILNMRNGEAQQIEQFDITIPAKQASTITSGTTLPYETLTEEYEVADGELLTYFVDGGALPYVDLQDFILLLDGFIYSDDIEFLWNEQTQILTLSYSVTYTDEITQEETTEDYEATLDFMLNTITVADTSFFSGYIHSTETDYSAGLNYLDEYYFEEGNAIVYDLNAYRFDMIYHQGDYVLPFHLVNLLFCGGSYFNVYYNGTGYKGIYAYGDDDDDFMTGSINNTPIPADVRLATFDQFAFTLDYFYGLKEEQDVATYYDALYLSTNNYLSNIAITSTRAYSDFVLEVLDELHSSMVYGSAYQSTPGNTPSLSLADLGPNTYDWYMVYFEVDDLLNARWSDGNIPAFRVIDGTNTAIIFLEEFITKSVDDPETVVDTNDYMRDAIDGILAVNPNVESIVIDISANTGGNLGALYRVLGYITENPIASHYQNPLTQEKTTYWLEVDTVANTEINWYFMTSKMTFSAANLMAAIGKYQDVATIIGTTSGGGACSVLPIYLPDGSGYQISSLNMISYRTGSDVEGWTYIGIESGVDPDYELPVGSLTDDLLIAQLIEEIENGTAVPYQP